MLSSRTRSRVRGHLVQLHGRPERARRVHRRVRGARGDPQPGARGGEGRRHERAHSLYEQSYLPQREVTLELSDGIVAAAEKKASDFVGREALSELDKVRV